MRPPLFSSPTSTLISTTMDSRSFNSQAETFESSSRTEPCRVFTYYHPQYQPECSVHQDDQYASFIFGDCDCLGEPAYCASSVSKPCFESDSFLGSTLRSRR